MIGPELRELLCGMLARDPSKRISLKAVLAHSWLQEPASQAEIAVELGEKF